MPPLLLPGPGGGLPVLLAKMAVLQTAFWALQRFPELGTGHTFPCVQQYTIAVPPSSACLVVTPTGTVDK